MTGEAQCPVEGPYCDNGPDHVVGSWEGEPRCNGKVRPALVSHVDEEPPWAGHEYRFDGRINSCADYGRNGVRCALTMRDPIHVTGTTA